MSFRDEHCRACREITSGDCGHHGPRLIPTPQPSAAAVADRINERLQTEVRHESPRQFRVRVMTEEIDAFARDREVAVWEEAAKVLDKCSAVVPVTTGDESVYAAQLAIKLALTAIGIELRGRARLHAGAKEK